MLALAAGASLAAPTGRAAEGTDAAAGAEGPALDLYRITASPAEVDRLERDGYDVAATRPDGTTEIVLGPGELARLKAAGFRPTRWRNEMGRSVADLARAQAGSGYQVWKRWDGPSGLRAELDALAAIHPNLMQTRVVGRSVQGRDIVAARLTAGAPSVPDGTRPAVLYLGLQHAREWISGEVPRRLLLSLLGGYGIEPDITRLLETTELWFLPVANPDGYELTFEPSHRLWRKNVADNDDDGTVGIQDGVDINRNLPDHWAFAPMGSSHVPADLTYRGPSAASEPETKVLVELATRLRFRFIVNYHSFGKKLLYPIGWQEQTPTADQPVYAALAGTPVNPAIPGFKPMLSADLYPTNGETMSWAHDGMGTLAFTVELGEGVPGSTFAFPDNEALVEQEFQLNRPFALDVARSAVDPTRPVSHLGNTVAPITVDAFPVSYGDPQPVQATALRRLGPVTMHWQIGDGPTRQTPAVEWAGGVRYGDTGSVYYHRVRGAVIGTRPGDSVKVWFTAGGQKSEVFTYQVAPHTDSKVLIVIGGDHRPAAENLPGPDGPVDRLSPVRAALQANGIEADTYDVDANGRVAPDPLGVLGHYEVVVWSTNEEQRTDSVSLAPGRVSRLANEEMLAARAFLNEGGRLLYMGRDAGRPYAEGALYDPVADGACVPDPPGPGVYGYTIETAHDCRVLSSEFFQYWLGAYEQASAGGNSARQISAVDGVRVFEGLSWSFANDGIAPGRNAAAYTASAETLGAAYPAVAGRAAAQYRGLKPNPSGPARNAVAAATQTPWSILFGFGFEDIGGTDQQSQVMGRALQYLLAPR